ncbi:histidine phosphatase family protein [bacterium]|nr:histidine phosphatase family protein [bacterium]
MKIGQTLPPSVKFEFRPLTVGLGPVAASLQDVVSDSVDVRAAEPLQSVPIGPEFAAFETLDPHKGTIRCLDLDSLKQRAGRLEVLGIRLIGVRHGESELNARGGGATLSGRGDTPLSPKGRQQAQAAASQLYQQLGGEEWLRKAALEPDRLPVLVASPLSRAYDTGAALQSLLHEEADRLSLPPLSLPVEKDPDLQEIDFGRCEGADARQVSQTYPNFGGGVDFLHRFPGGESGLDIMGRLDRFLTKVEKEHVGRTVIFFGHTMSLGVAQLLLGQTKIEEGGRVRIDRSKLPNATPMTLTNPAPLKESLDGWYLG